MTTMETEDGLKLMSFAGSRILWLVDTGDRLAVWPLRRMPYAFNRSGNRLIVSGGGRSLMMVETDPEGWRNRLRLSSTVQLPLPELASQIYGVKYEFLRAWHGTPDQKAPRSGAF